ncbi:HCL541Cp [Eremothecium sinecaudum]|uniref:Ribonucleoside-diphosphate reductase n=1 Tax=Eremothecium sinecaudum TaxID=45286 RepID=A0A109UY25_9SACH|nr:HCL541Cp [Eremothecium sinecaudum]AMD19610.1 HCL541Cp [Eremothecium sinecaudum]
MMTNPITVKNKLGETSSLSEDDLLEKLTSLSFGLNTKYMNLGSVVEKIMTSIPSEISEEELTGYMGETLQSSVTSHPDFSTLAARVEVSELHNRLSGVTFSQNLGLLFNGVKNTDVDGPPGKKQKLLTPTAISNKSLISSDFYEMALKYSDVIDKAIDLERDYEFTYFGWKTLCKSYLLKDEAGVIHETPQFLFMRVALAIHGPFEDVDSILATYKLMSEKYFIHATPTLFNAGTINQFLSSCFLLGIVDDSIDGIYKTLHKTAMISKASGGIGLHISNIRGRGAPINGSNGASTGIVPMLRVFNNTARYVDQGGNKRPGAFCIYLEPWHCDIIEFLQLRKNHGAEELRARDLFFALWIPDLFMKRVENDEEWSLFSPDSAPGLADCYGEEFERLYEKYERELVPVKRMKAHQIWREILSSQTETGGPFMLYKDSCNRKSNQKNLGTIKSSNLCCEIIEYSSPDEIAVCNLASVALPTYIKVENSKIWFDYDKLHSVVKLLTKNLDRIIDVCKYPVPETEYSNKRNRPLAIGVQGFADTLMMLRLPFESDDAAELNRNIFETIYHAAVESSIELAAKYGAYETFTGSPASEGLLQFDLWGLNKENYEFFYNDWDDLKAKLKDGPGMRNSLLVAPMPTASTSQILGFTESFEPMTSMIYARRVLSGEYKLVNRYMVQDFCDLGIWDEKLKNRIIHENGSVQSIEGIPKELKDIYKTVWEMSQRKLVDLSCGRAPFIDQSQSLNLYLKTVTMGKLTSMHFYTWKKGLKTGMYYLRTQAASSAIKFTINDENTLSGPVTIPEKPVSKLEYVRRYHSEEPLLLTPSSKDRSLENMSSPSGSSNFSIHDDTPIVCGIFEEGKCQGCSG